MCKIFCKALKSPQQMACCFHSIKFRINDKAIIKQLALFKSTYNKKSTGCTLYCHLVYTNCSTYRVVPSNDEQ